MSNIVNGKKPLSQKPKAASVSYEDVFGNPLALGQDIKDACTEKGLAYRFVSYPKLQAMGGWHEYGWRPVKRAELGLHATMDPQAFQFGNSPDDLIRRGDLVLAVRPIEVNEKHKQYLRQEAERRAHVQRRHAKELRKSSPEGVKISEGYDEDQQ